ncbi:MAG TPA: MMPL family transporter [Acidimicrobiales bacterium]|nr:MMPL family transporter [Acidimicrobiales bacterium]
MFASLGRWCYRRRWFVIAAWLVVLVAGGGLLSAAGTESRSDFDLPDVESRRGTEIIEDHFGGVGAGWNGSVVFEADQGVASPEVEAAMTELFAAIDDIEGVEVISPYAPEGAAQISQRGDRAGEIAFADVELPSETTQEEAAAITDEVERLVPEIDGVDIYLGGEIFADFEAPSSEAIGLGFAVIILIFAFGSVLAMGLPIGVALAGIGIGSIAAGFLSHLVAMPDFASVLGVMIGLGVGIDYALFIVTRFRENLHHGHDMERATVIAMDTAGRAVLFAGTTVVISLLGMLVMNVSFITGLAVGTAAVVAVTLVASLTLLPALLGFAGERLETTRWRGLVAAGVVAVALVGLGLGIGAFAIGLPLAAVVMLAGFAVRPLRREVPRPARKPLRETAAYRWSRLIQHHPWPTALLGAGLLAVLAVPTFGMRLGFSDEGNYPESTDTRKAYDLKSAGFGPGFNGPLVLTSLVPEGGIDDAELARVTDAVAAADGVETVTPGFKNDPENPAAVVWRVIPTTAPQDDATNDTVAHLRDDVLPAATAGTGLDVAVTGSVAVQVDFSEYLAARLGVFFGAVLTLSFLLLMVVFRSVLVPLKAVIMNLLSIGAAYGVVVAAFQWGWAGPLLGIDSAPIEPFIPMMLFAIVFGLSMDYEVFLLSRVREEWDRTGDSRTSVADGLAATAKVITAAAAIMVVVFGSFLLESNRVVQLFGVGLATAVLLDATVVRMLLVPATMELLGDRNWWLPRWLDRVLPRIDVEGHEVLDDVDDVTGEGAVAAERELENA